MSTNGEAGNPIEQLASGQDAKRIPHPKSNEYIAVFRLDNKSNTVYKLVTDDGTVIRTSWSSSECSVCNENESYSPRRGTPYDTAQEERKQANCEHAQFASDAFSLASVGACDDCGAWAVSPKSMPHPTVSGAVAAVEEYCAACGKLRET
ncbi:hypothetical protein [Haloarcula sp. K1]|uniref:hypothetical protein n=1 Tax=Haloarcula sp. K1 TaxID=1622207 RepID=UPI000AAC66EE|nr:hypothetical protein [Haloarcula sp. K1]